MWSRQIGEAAGVSIPLYPNEHFYMITENYKNLPELLPTFRDPDTYLYIREYHKKIMIGIFEPNAKNAFKKTGIVPNNFSFGEFKVNKDYSNMLHKLASKRIIDLKRLKIEKYFSGPESFTPDSNFLLGETEGIKIFMYVAALIALVLVLQVELERQLLNGCSMDILNMTYLA